MKGKLCLLLGICLFMNTLVSCGTQKEPVSTKEGGESGLQGEESAVLSETGTADLSEESQDLLGETGEMDEAAQDVIVVDFSVKEGFPLLKRQNMFSIGTGLKNYAHLTRDAWLLQDLRSENMRIDLGMGGGGFASRLGANGVELTDEDFSSPDMMSKVLIGNGIMPYFCYCYMPFSLQIPKVKDMRIKKMYYPPDDYEGWKTLCRNIAAHYESLGYPIAGHEIWNEPDLSSGSSGAFYQGTWEEYYKMYQYAVLGIREANPDARVGGLSLSNIDKVAGEGRVDEFLQYVIDNGLPLDFMSFHHYGTEGYLDRIRLANEILSGYGDAFATTGFDLTEFHISTDWSPEGCSRSALIPDIWDAILSISEQPTVTSVNWAAWRDSNSSSRLGMVDYATGKRYAPHNAISIYNRMPIARVKMDTKGYAEGFASVEEHRAGVVVYNRTEETKPVTAALDNLPFETADIKVYAIDEEHSSYVDTKAGDELECIWSRENVPTQGLYYSGDLVSRGSLYIEIVDHEEPVELKAVWSLRDGVALAGEKATVIKKEYYFPDRAKRTFAEFDLGSFTAYAGMGDAELGTGMGGVILKNLPDSFTVTKESWGANQEMSQDANQFLKVDYRGEDGKVLYSELYQQGSETVPSVPWSDRAPDRVQQISEGEPFILDFQEAPEGFGGTIVLTYGITDYGSDTTVRFRLE